MFFWFGGQLVVREREELICMVFRQEAQTFFGFDAEAIEAAVGNGFTFEGGDVDKFRNAIPANVALGVESCLKKCNIPKNK